MSRRVPLVVVPMEGRGDLPLALFRGVPLLECAIAALRSALPESTIVISVDETQRSDALTSYASLPGVEVGAPGSWDVLEGDLLVHDPLCPGASPDDVVRVLASADAGGCVAAYRPVTDTLKVVEDGIVAATLDRESVVAIASPVLIPEQVRRPAPDLSGDLGAVVETVRRRGPVTFVEASPLARRVGDLDALRVLEALAAVAPVA